MTNQKSLDKGKGIKEKFNEIRLNSDGEFDDIVAEDLDYIHIEQMDNNYWWIGIGKKGKVTMFDLVATRSGIKCISHQNQLKLKIIKHKK